MEFSWFNAFMFLLFIFTFAVALLLFVLLIDFVAKKISNPAQKENNITNKSNTNSDKK